jgi:serine/threonine-protein kinase RsbW
LGKAVRTERALRRTLAADAVAPSIIRGLLRGWLRALDWPADEADDLVLATSEAVSNVADHAYPPGRVGRAIVDARCVTERDGRRQVIITVADAGRWRPPPAWHQNRRRGLPIMRACTASLDVRPTTSGTRVRMVSNPVPARP